jgi:hypothetical protein
MHKDYETDKPFIAKKDLVDNGWYKGYNRIADKGIWNAEKSRFEFVRIKFGDWRMDWSRHPEDDDEMALFYPFEFICNNE